jgi:putative lipase involved disintegration of autophagic bodies
MYPDCHVCVMGHSLGGAMSTLLATKIDVDLEIPKPVVAFTFGSPYVGDERFLS